MNSHERRMHKRRAKEEAYAALEKALDELSILGYLPEATFRSLQRQVAKVAVKNPDVRI